jgi:hypothetical protein
MLKRRPRLTPIGIYIGKSVDEMCSAAAKKYSATAQQAKCEATCLIDLVSGIHGGRVAS